MPQTSDTTKKIECKGSFQRLPLDAFKLDSEKRYSDLYILRKGLWERFGGVLDEEGNPVWDEEKGQWVKSKNTVEDE
jgi:hypothetical protein